MISEIDDCRINVSHILQSHLKSDGRKRYGTPSQQLSAFNKRSLPEIINLPTPTFWLRPKENVQNIVGADVLRLNPNGNFNIHFPIRRGEFNIHKKVGGSCTSVIEHLRCILEFAILNFLDVNLKDLPQYKAVLVISDVYSRKRVKLLAGLLFDMGFKACILIQEHVVSTYIQVSLS